MRRRAWPRMHCGLEEPDAGREASRSCWRSAWPPQAAGSACPLTWVHAWLQPTVTPTQLPERGSHGFSQSTPLGRVFSKQPGGRECGHQSALADPELV